MKLIIILSAFLILLNIPIEAQVKKNSITGKVFDGSTKSPLEYATISVINKETGKTVTGAIADERGAFAISNLPDGAYKLDIEFIGYQKDSIPNIVLGSNKRYASLGAIFLNPLTHSLEGVTISADKPIVENKIDKVVYNASNDITSQGGLAIDVLKKVPNVTVDIDGNVELQGNSNIRFLINGKPSSVFGNSLSDALAAIPASQIKSIEAITNPGAKYDSQGTGGIINIILQDNKLQGVSGNISLSAGTRLENGSANFNVKRKNFGINAFFGGNAFLNSKVPNSFFRSSTDTLSGDQSTLSQSAITEFKRHGFRSGLGFDWDISKNDNVTANAGYNEFGNSFSGLTNQEQEMTDNSGNIISDITSVRDVESQTKVPSFEWSVDYKRKFKKEGQELEILFNNSNSKPRNNYTQNQFLTGVTIPFSGSSSLNPGTNNETNISVDYAHPVTENFIIETGAKTTMQNITSIADVRVLVPSSGEYVNDPLQSYDLNYKMKVYAGYLSASYTLFGSLKVKSGLRFEQTDVRLNLENSSVPSYGTLVPSLVFSYDINKNHSIKLAFTKRIERPEYRELNPFVNLSDPFNITTGNLLLKPEIGNNLELGYNATFKKGGNISISLIERINTQDHKQVTTFYPAFLVGDSTYSNVYVTNTQNVGEEYNSGISMSGSYQFSKQFNLRANLMVTQRYSVTTLSTGNTSTGVRVRANMNATYQLPKDLVFELSGFYNSASRSIQGKVPQFFIYTLAFRKLFWNKNASFGFTATNLFQQYIRQVSTISTETSMSSSLRKLPFRSFGIAITYKFGKMEPGKKRRESENSPAPEENNQ